MDSSGSRFAGFTPWLGCWELNLGPQDKQYVSLTTESSLWSFCFYFLTSSKGCQFTGNFMSLQQAEKKDSVLCLSRAMKIEHSRSSGAGRLIPIDSNQINFQTCGSLFPFYKQVGIYRFPLFCDVLWKGRWAEPCLILVFCTAQTAQHDFYLCK